ncbi:hypothetical protein P2D89_22120 [Agrobacterium rhizogenes]|nr:hypothetical protein [Rhizobium rhizogenes]MDF1891701.1 hypothetical protein [Rhizobium rhizogenes]
MNSAAKMRLAKLGRKILTFVGTKATLQKLAAFPERRKSMR